MNQVFWKGHGTGNDFIIIEDLDDTNAPGEGVVRAWCDRHFGVGADGLLRVVRDPSGKFFMDYRNADGSIAEMCGNGLRVFARHLIERHLVDGAIFDVLTRAGFRSVRVLDDEIQVAMGAAKIGETTWIELAGRRYEAIAVDVGNPHAVVQLDAMAELAGLDLNDQPAFDEQLFPAGVNVEFCYSPQPGSVNMRVHERGVGETLSCGTGVVASAAVHAARADVQGQIRVQVPGGILHVEFDDAQAWLTGPAVIIAHGELRQIAG